MGSSLKFVCLVLIVCGSVLTVCVFVLTVCGSVLTVCVSVLTFCVSVITVCVSVITVWVSVLTVCVFVLTVVCPSLQFVCPSLQFVCPSLQSESSVEGDSQQYPWNLYLIEIVEDIVVFLSLKVFNSDNSHTFSWYRNTQVIFAEIPHLKIISFLKL